MNGKSSEADQNRGESEQPPQGDNATEVAKKGGKESARRSAERDWQDSAKESGE